MESPMLLSMARSTPPFWRSFAAEFFPALLIGLVLLWAFFYFFTDEFGAVVRFVEGIVQ
jgi:hypothetical protein